MMTFLATIIYWVTDKDTLVIYYEISATEYLIKKQTDLVVSRTFALALLMCILHRVPREVGQLTKIPPIKSSCVQFCEKFHQVDTNNYHCVSKKFPPLKSV